MMVVGDKATDVAWDTRDVQREDMERLVGEWVCSKLHVWHDEE